MVSPEVVRITLLSLYVSGTSTILAAILGVTLGGYIGLRRTRTPRFFRNVLYVFFGFPPVLAGLLFFFLLSRSGPLAPLGLIFTPLGMVLAQTFLITPIIAGVTSATVNSVGRQTRETALALGANERQLRWTLLREARHGVLTAIMLGFGRAISEVGAVIIVGGNIRGHTQVLTTSIIQDIQAAQYGEAIALGLILLLIAGAVFFTLSYFQERDSEWP